MAGVENLGQHVNKANIAVIGGGYSGMAAAVRIVEGGGVPTVFESARVLGGRARRIEYLGRTLDNGQHILSGAYSELLRLMNVIGLSANVVQRVPLRLSMPPDFLLRAPMLPAPWHMAVALLTAKGLTFSDRLRAIGMMQALKKSQFMVPAWQTVGELLAQHRQSQHVIHNLWQPLTVSALNTPITRASAQVFANVLCDALAGPREASDLLLPQVDLTALFPAPAADWVVKNGGQVVLGQRVDALTFNPQHVTLQVGGSTQNFDAAVLAVGPHQRAEFGSVLAADGSPPLRYEPITTIYFGFASRVSLPLAMLGQAHGLCHWFFDRRQLSATPDAPELVVAAVISASGPHDELETDALAAHALAELRQHLPTLPAPSWQKVVREKFATFACTPDAPRPSSRTASPRIFLASDDVANPRRNYPATLEGTVRNGIAAADAAMQAVTQFANQ